MISDSARCGGVSRADRQAAGRDAGCEARAWAAAEEKPYCRPAGKSRAMRQLVSVCTRAYGGTQDKSRVQLGIDRDLFRDQNGTESRKEVVGRSNRAKEISIDASIGNYQGAWARQKLASWS